MQESVIHSDGAGSTTAMVLRARGLVKRYRGFELGPIDLELHRGHVYGLLGVNGTGKTTLLSCLAQQARLDEGALAIGAARAVWSDYSHRERVALVRETPVLYESLSATQHLRLASGLFARWNQALAECWLDVFRLDRRKRVRHLSKGMRVKLALILALAHEPPFLLLDEPMNGVDVESRDELQECLQAMAAEGRAAILVSSHVFQDIDALATDLLILREGRLVFTSACDALCLLATWTLPAAGSVRLPSSHEPLRTWTNRHGRYLLSRGPVPVSDADTPAGSHVRRARLEDVYFAFARGAHGQ